MTQEDRDGSKVEMYFSYCYHTNTDALTHLFPFLNKCTLSLSHTLTLVLSHILTHAQAGRFRE